MKKVLLLDVVGLTTDALAHMPRLAELANRGRQTHMNTILPAVTCSVQSTILTGRMPREHGIVGNGWYFRGLGDAMLWRQHNTLVTADKIWDTMRREGDYRVANVGWWYAMGAATEVAVTPRPIYHSDGRKSPDAYVRPAWLHDELVGSFGEFPLFQYWGPTASIASSNWLIGAAQGLLSHRWSDDENDLTMVYLPHLDYAHQKYGPHAPESAEAAAELDASLAPLLDDAENLGMTVIALAEYGIAPASRPVHINRALRREGLLEVYVQQGLEQLDPWTSRAFAVSDHQVAHVYVNDPADLARTADVLRELPGVDLVLDREHQAAYGIDHERAGELVVVAEPGAWFTYYFWLDDDRAPEYARAVDIHKKPGYDPAELFMNPADPLAKAKAGMNLVKKKLGLRYAMSTVPLDGSYVRGTHGRLPDSLHDTPLLICSDPSLIGDGVDSIDATAVHELLRQAHGAPVQSAVGT
ncbi:MAG: alkaline phosphatase family protein [Microbacterium gubbeenense]|uniref:nucleotide pyrophosphatase/phosphodiesterase family protein n=3 Tax=Microbacterium gubbeenense TaxID=159896 RepID=UPI0004103FE8|nr:nucleotide pyrophosphatase/phosphodiesterase family protein [Microbacterium gubbeenense]